VLQGQIFSLQARIANLSEVKIANLPGLNSDVPRIMDQ
jgi:hypothetical protein